MLDAIQDYEDTTGESIEMAVSVVKKIKAAQRTGSEDDPKVVSLFLTPRERVMSQNASQQLRVVARYSNGREADVTALAKFQSNNDALASVSGSGLVATSEQTDGSRQFAQLYLRFLRVRAVPAARRDHERGSTRWPADRASVEPVQTPRRSRALFLRGRFLQRRAYNCRRGTDRLVNRHGSAARPRRDR